MSVLGLRQLLEHLQPVTVHEDIGMRPKEKAEGGTWIPLEHIPVCFVQAHIASAEEMSWNLLICRRAGAAYGLA